MKSKLALNQLDSLLTRIFNLDVVFLDSGALVGKRNCLLFVAINEFSHVYNNETEEIMYRMGGQVLIDINDACSSLSGTKIGYLTDRIVEFSPHSSTILTSAGGISFEKKEILNEDTISLGFVFDSSLIEFKPTVKNKIEEIDINLNME